MFDICPPWYAKFVNDMDENTLCELILAANMFDIDPLVDLLSAKIALILKDKSIEERRRFFGVENDYTTEDLERIDRENEEAIDIYELEDDNSWIAYW